MIGRRMIRRRDMLRGIATIPLLGIAACGAGGKRFPDYRYRLTVEVETPDGVRSGSSVIEVYTAMRGANDLPTPNVLFKRMKGEAVAVDLPNRQTLFALLRSEMSVDWAKGPIENIIPKSDIPRGEGSEYQRRFDVMLQRKGVYELPRQFLNDPPHIAKSDKPSAYPMLVTFKNIADPKTVKKVDPDDLAATFGEGYALKRITLQLTDDPVTTGIEKYLDQMGIKQDQGLDDDFDPTPIPTLAQTIGYRDFKKDAG